MCRTDLSRRESKLALTLKYYVFPDTREFIAMNGLRSAFG
jgi:hypothetical protein